MTTTKYNDSDFSSRLRALRGDRTQSEFSKFLGIASQQTYQNYERGRVPKPAVLQRIAQQLGVSPTWLLFGDHSKTMESAAGEIPKTLHEDVVEYKAKDYAGMFHRLANTADLGNLIDQIEMLAVQANQGDLLAESMLPYLKETAKRRIEELKTKDPKP